MAREPGRKPSNSTNCNNAVFKIKFDKLNFKPTGADSFFTVTATDTLNFSTTSTDRDKYDSVFIEPTSISTGNIPKPWPAIDTRFGRRRCHSKLAMDYALRTKYGRYIID
jgi:hypothetical protein